MVDSLGSMVQLYSTAAVHCTVLYKPIVLYLYSTVATAVLVPWYHGTMCTVLYCTMAGTWALDRLEALVYLTI